MNAHELVEYLILVIDYTGIAVMLLGFFKAAFHFSTAISLRLSAEKIALIQQVRCDFGVYLVFALELMIVSDLLTSVVSHSLEDLYFLGALVLIRTMIAYFLNQEIQELGSNSYKQ